MLHLASKFTRNRDHLKHIYKTFIRCNLEFSSTVWHSSLTQADRQDLERIQKAAVKVILKNDYESYEQALGLLKIESLDQRRETMALKFAKNSLKNHNFSKLFPLKMANHQMKVRNSEKYVVNTSKTKRYQESAVPYLQGLLNRDYFEERQSFKRLFEDESLKYDAKKQRYK